MLSPKLRVTLFLVLWALVSCQKTATLKPEDSNAEDNQTADYYGSKANKAPVQKTEPLPQPKRRVLVIDFWNDTPVSQEKVGKFAADELRASLLQSKKVILPEDTKSEFATEDFVDGDRVKVSQLIREGRKQGVGMIIIGRIKRITFRQKGDDVGLFRRKQSMVAVELEIKLFDIQGGREIVGSTKQGEASSSVMVALADGDVNDQAYKADLIKNAIRDAAGGFVPEIVKAADKLTWQGRIAKIVGPRIYVNAGRVSGLVIGDILRVMTSGDDVYDPESGAYLGRSQGQVKGTLEVTEFVGTDGATTQVHSGGNFHEGDLVELY